MITAASTLKANGITTIETATQAAEALRPFAGDFAFVICPRNFGHRFARCSDSCRICIVRHHGSVWFKGSLANTWKESPVFTGSLFSQRLLEFL